MEIRARNNDTAEERAEWVKKNKIRVTPEGCWIWQKNSQEGGHKNTDGLNGSETDSKPTREGVPQMWFQGKLYHVSRFFEAGIRGSL